MSSTHGQSFLYGPKIPYIGFIPHGVFAGKSISLKGLVLANGPKRLTVNLCCGLLVEGEKADDIALHADFRWDERCVVLNALMNNRWTDEMRLAGIPLSAGQPFTLRIQALHHCYKIEVNGRHLYDFEHRLSLDSVKTLYVKGPVQLDYIEFQGDSPAKVAPTAPLLPSPTVLPQNFQVNLVIPSQTQPVFAQAPPILAQQPIVNPTLPYRMPIAGGFAAGRQLSIAATPTPKAKQIYIDLLANSGDIAFHFNARFQEQIVVRNTQRNGSWETEERMAPNFPFQQSRAFEMIVFCDNDAVKVAVNGVHFIRFAHRMPPHLIDQLHLAGDLAVQHVQLQ